MTTSRQEVIEKILYEYDNGINIGETLEMALNKAYEEGLKAGQELYRVGW